MILHTVSVRVRAHLHLICCSQTVILVYLSSLPWKLSEQNHDRTFKTTSLSAEKEEKFMVMLTQLLLTKGVL